MWRMKSTLNFCGAALLKRRLRSLSLAAFCRSQSVATTDVCVGHIIDDVCLVGFGTTQSFLLDAQRRIWSAFTKFGLPIKSSKSTALGSLVSTHVTFIGFVWDFGTGLLRPKDDRIASARVLQGQSDASFGKLESEAFQSLVGKVIWMNVGRRPLLSLLRLAVLPCALTSPTARTASVRELRQFGRLADLAVIDTYRPLSTIVFNTDASEHGGVLLVSRATSNERYTLLIHSRYNGGHLHSDTAPVRAFVKARPWRVLLSYASERPAHINELEAAAILVALRWFLSNHAKHTRVVLLSDSGVFLGVLATGRSWRLR